MIEPKILVKIRAHNVPEAIAKSREIEQASNLFLYYHMTEGWIPDVDVWFAGEVQP